MFKITPYTESYHPSTRLIFFSYAQLENMIHQFNTEPECIHISIFRQLRSGDVPYVDVIVSRPTALYYKIIFEK
jgi:hypothetical protein